MNKLFYLFFILLIPFIFAFDESGKLFDIDMDLEDVYLFNSSDLTAVVVFESFGNISMPVYVRYSIYDEDGKLLYEKPDEIIVNIEEVRRVNFNNLNLDPGVYRFVFSTIYNVDVYDEFETKFIILESENSSSIIVWLIVGLVIVLIVILYAAYKNKT